MGFIYIIKNIINNKLYVGQTTRTIQIRWKEHRVKAKNRLLNNAIKQDGVESFIFILTKEIDNDKLDEEETQLIKLHNTIHPNGYNMKNNGVPLFATTKGGESITGHDKHSKIMKERYKSLDHLKIFGDIPRGISYWKGIKNGNEYEGFVVRKIGIKTKEYKNIKSNNKLKNNLNKAKLYLENALNKMNNGSRSTTID
jgi:group I intron endonuclease